MEIDQLDAFEARLRSMLALEGEADQGGQAAARTVELDQTRVGRLSRMDALQAQAMSVEVNLRRSELIRQIKAALARIDTGDYGYCVSCGEEINPKRLAFDPAVAICMDCATRAENGAHPHT
jgi:DnaK suppressor protein